MPHVWKSIAVAALAVFSLAACSGTPGAPPKETGSTHTPNRSVFQPFTSGTATIKYSVVKACSDCAGPVPQSGSIALKFTPSSAGDVLRFGRGADGTYSADFSGAPDSNYIDLQRVSAGTTHIAAKSNPAEAVNIDATKAIVVQVSLFIPDPTQPSTGLEAVSEDWGVKDTGAEGDCTLVVDGSESGSMSGSVDCPALGDPDDPDGATFLIHATFSAKL